MTEASEHLPFALPDVGDAEIDAVVTALRSGWLSSGPAVKEFESAFAARIGAGVQAIAVNSATAGLHLALEACGIAAGDEVLIPTWTFTATAEVVRYLGARPVMVDVNPTHLNIDLRDAEKKVTSKTRAIVPVHFAGYPVEPAPLREFATFHGLRVVEDAAHAFPAQRDGERVGAGSSDATVFSFYATKTMTTGEGGMVVTRDTELADRIRVMRLHGISRDAFDRYRSSRPSWHYEVIAPGYKYNLTDPAAAMGLVQLKRAEEMRSRRQLIAEQYSAELSGLPLELPAGHGLNGTHSWHLYVIRVPSALNRDVVIQDLARIGISTSVHFIPLHMHPYWRDTEVLDEMDFPVASAAYRRVISLPLYSSMSEGDVERVIAAVRQCCQ
jgi:dTDP-4-amino-4,6-dideoxygalactose transaminase